MVHELAHMWFGNLVTMNWFLGELWQDLNNMGEEEGPSGGKKRRRAC